MIYGSRDARGPLLKREGYRKTSWWQEGGSSIVEVVPEFFIEATPSLDGRHNDSLLETLVREVSYPSVEMQSVYTTAPAD